MTKEKVRFLKEMTTPEVETAIKSNMPLFIPIGTLEAHGRHLPISTDTYCAEGLAQRLSLTFNGIVAPSIEYGLTNVFLQTAPASFFPIEVFKTHLEHIIRNFRKHGFKTIVLINGHGGNREPLKDIIRGLTRECGLSLGIVNWWLTATQFVKEIYSCEPAYHAAVEETAAILHFNPELVKAKDYNSDEDDYVVDDNIWLYPPPGEVLLEKNGEGQPCFEADKAEKFMTLVMEDLEKKLDKWFKAARRFTGGLRPYE